MAEPGGLRSATQASMTTSALPVTLSSTEQAERCGWQVTREKFLWEGEPETILEEKAILGRGTVGEVQEVIAKSLQEFMVRKFVFVRRQNAQRVRNKTKTENQHLKLLEHTHIVKVLGCYGKWINGFSCMFYTLIHPMLSVVVGESIKQLRKFLFDDPTILQPYHEVVGNIVLWLRTNRVDPTVQNTSILQAVLALERSARPSASEILQDMSGDKTSVPGSSCICEIDTIDTFFFKPSPNINLKRYLESRPRDENPVQQLMSSYLCLASTLAYMHAKYVNVHDFGAEDIMASDTAIQFCSFKIWIARQMPLSKGPSSKDSVSAKQGMFYLGLVFPELLAAITRELPWSKWHALWDKEEQFFFGGPACQVEECYRTLPKRMCDFDIFKEVTEPLLEKNVSVRSTAEEVRVGWSDCAGNLKSRWIVNAWMFGVDGGRDADSIVLQPSSL